MHINKYLHTVILTSVLICSPLAFAEQTKPKTACQSDANYAQFDFWLGEWKVYDAKGKYQGSNKIVKSASGCLIKEFWTSASNNSGFSMNYYNPVTNQWSQKWVSAGSIIEYTGGIEDGSMVLNGHIYTHNKKSSAPFRGTWTQLDDGRVRQLFEQFDPNSKQWNIWFDGYYVKSLN